MLLCAAVFIHSLANRPIPNRYVRIDEMGRAQAIQYSDLSYSPREGEVRTYLTDWANYRYTINRETVAAEVPAELLLPVPAARFPAHDRRQQQPLHLAGSCRSGGAKRRRSAQRDDHVDVPGDHRRCSSTAKGTALVNLDRIYSARNSHEPRIEHWLLSVTYYLNPKEVSEEARIFPQFETINPLGLTITEFHENRVSVDTINPDADVQPCSAAYRSPAYRLELAVELRATYCRTSQRSLRTLLGDSFHLRPDDQRRGWGVFADRNGVVERDRAAWSPTQTIGSWQPSSASPACWDRI